MPELKILWINDRADFTGGCEGYIFHTARMLSEKGYHNTLLYDVKGWTEPSFIRIFDAAFPRVALKRQIAEIEPDIIYVHHLAGRQAISELLESGRPAIRFFHDHKLFCLREHKYKTISHQTCTQPTGWRCYPCLGFINRSEGRIPVKISSLGKLQAEQAVNKKLSGFIVASEYMKKHLTAHGFPADKIKVIPLYSWRDREEEPGKDGNYILYSGQIVRGKGIDILLKAMKLINTQIPLIIAGSGRQKQEYEELTQKLGLNELVKFNGFVNQEKLMKLNRDCTCLVMPSRVPETFGLSGLEAMSWSKPVVASDVGGISQWLKHGINGYLIKGNDPQAMASALDKLLSDRVRAAEMGRAGYVIYKKEFTPEVHLDSLMKYFERVIMGGK